MIDQQPSAPRSAPARRLPLRASVSFIGGSAPSSSPFGSTEHLLVAVYLLRRQMTRGWLGFPDGALAHVRLLYCLKAVAPERERNRTMPTKKSGASGSRSHWSQGWRFTSMTRSSEWSITHHDVSVG